MTAIGPGSELADGKYRLVRLLGSGGMGAVYEAENTLSHKRVALKILHTALSERPDAAERLVREAQASARVRHPNVVDVYDVGRDGSTIFLVMEYLEGVPLSKALEPPGLPMHRCIALLLPAMRAVAAAHRQGVVHRDIKPDNLFLAEEADTVGPIVKVLDFGISKFETRDQVALSLTRPGSPMGTPLYMSLEQLNGERDLDGRTDVYAFGVILYEALTGRLPFAADTLTSLFIQIMNHTPVTPKVLRPELPTALDRIVMWALARDREQRIPNMEALIRELEPFATEHGFRAEMTLADEAMTAYAPTLPGAPQRARSSPPPAPIAAQQKSDSDARPRTVGTKARSPRRIVVAVLGLALLLGGLGLALRPSAEEGSGPPEAASITGPRRSLPPELPSPPTRDEWAAREPSKEQGARAVTSESASYPSSRLAQDAPSPIAAPSPGTQLLPAAPKARPSEKQKGLTPLRAVRPTATPGSPSASEASSAPSRAAERAESSAPQGSASQAAGPSFRVKKLPISSEF
jgi:serine/threonine-protein kinase